MKRVAVCIQDYDIDFSTPILNLLDCLADRFQVDLFLRGVNLRSSPILLRDSVSVFLVGNKPGPKVAFSALNRSLRQLAKRLLRGSSGQASDGKARRLSHGALHGHRGQVRYDRHICFDPHGFLLCKELFPSSRPVHFSLELYLRDDYLDRHYPQAKVRAFRQVMERERSMISDLGGLIVQSRERAELFVEDYGLGSDLPIFLLPVTCSGVGDRRKSNRLREQYEISPDTRIALHLGGINDWFASLEIAQVFSTLPDWVVVFQGNHLKSYLQSFRRAIDLSGATNIIVSDTFFSDIESLEPIVRSADVGIAWYKDISKNFASAARSSGKIAAYLRAGVPVVANAYPGFVESIAGTGCGVCVDRVEEIPQALLTLGDDYERFSDAAAAEYERTYRFEHYQDELVEFLLGGSA